MISPSDALTLQHRVAVNKPEVYQMFGSGTVLHDMIESGSDVTQATKVIGESDGEYMYLMQQSARPGNMATGMVHGDAFPEGGDPTWRRATYTHRDIASSISFSRFTTQITGGGNMSYDDLMSLQIDATITENRKIMNRQMLGDGTGRLATVSAGGWANSTSILTVSSVDDLRIGDELVLRNPTTGGFRAGSLPSNFPVTADSLPKPLKVTAKSTSNVTVTLTYYDGSEVLEDDGSTEFASTDFNGMSVYRYDAQGKDLWGIGIMCSTSNPGASGYDPASVPTSWSDRTIAEALFGGIDRTSNADWQPYNVAAGSNPISVENHIQVLLRNLRKRTEGDIGWLLGITGEDVRDKVAQELARQNRTDFATKLVAPGDPTNPSKQYYAVCVQNLYIVADHDADPTSLLVIEPDVMFRAIDEDWHIDMTGTADGLRIKTNAISRAKAEYDVRWITRQQLMAARILGFGSITGISATI